MKVDVEIEGEPNSFTEIQLKLSTMMEVGHFKQVLMGYMTKDDIPLIQGPFFLEFNVLNQD